MSPVHHNTIKQTLGAVLKDMRRLAEMVNAGGTDQAYEEMGFRTGLTGKNGSYLCSAKAQEQLGDLIDKLIAADPDLRGRITDRAYGEAFELEFVSRLFEGNASLDRDAIEAIRLSARSAALKTLQTQRYHFPVYTISEDKTDTYQVGPCEFTRVNHFFDTHRAQWAEARARELRAYIEGHAKFGTQFETSSLGDRYLKAESYYRQFGWLASVEIENADAGSYP